MSDERARLLALVEQWRSGKSQDRWQSAYQNGKTEAFWECADELAALLPPVGQEMEREVRETLWLNHGCPVSILYGDDGEMQCNAMTCRLDFKRTPLPELLMTLFANGRLHAGLHPAPVGQEEPLTIGQCTARHTSGPRRGGPGDPRCQLPWPHYGNPHWSDGFSWPNSERPAVARNDSA